MGGRSQAVAVVTHARPWKGRFRTKGLPPSSQLPPSLPRPVVTLAALPELCQRLAWPWAAHTLTLLCLKALGLGPAPYPTRHHPPSRGDMGCPRHPVTLLCSGPESTQASILHRCLFVDIPDCRRGLGSLPTYFALRASLALLL